MPFDCDIEGPSLQNGLTCFLAHPLYRRPAVQRHAAQVGSDVVITLGDNDSITLVDFKLSLLDASDFVF